MSARLATQPIAQETDIVAVRQQARLIASLLGFDAQDQIRVATAASEIARNAFGHAGGGQAAFLLEDRQTPQQLVIAIRDEGPGFADLDAVLQGRKRPAAGISGARRLMDGFEIKPNAGSGVTVTLRKTLPRRQARLTPRKLEEITRQLSAQVPPDPVVEIRVQNRDLLQSLNDERQRQEELAHLSSELQDTNRGVVALYAELDEKAEQLRQASELKSRFLSNMTHEFRTPLNSILALTELLLDQVDGPLHREQAKQIEYIRKSAHSLTELVNDLLDLAKVESGKLDVRVTEFSVTELFGALRGALRPLRRPAVELIFDAPEGISGLKTDETKLAQILRNFVSNGLKFTERGEVRVSVRRDETGKAVFCVRDTGIGIKPEHHETIFQEFAQVENILQDRVKGTGLGLALSKKLAELLGGSVTVRSTPGQGSSFFLTLPAETVIAGALAVPDAKRILVIDDEETFRYVLRQMLGTGRHEIFEARNGVEGVERARALRPDVVFLDLMMQPVDGFTVLGTLRQDPATASSRIIVITSSIIGAAERRRLAEADTIISKETLSRAALAALLTTPETGQLAWR